MRIVGLLLAMVVWPPVTLASPPFSPEPSQRGPFPVVVRERRPVLAAEVTLSKYPANNLLDVWNETGKEWRPDFFKSPELVSLYRSVYASQRDRESEARLMAPQWCVDRVLDATREQDASSIEDKLRDTSFVVRCDVGPYVIIAKRIPNPGPGQRERYMPVMLRQFDGEFRETLEIFLTDPVQFACGIAWRSLSDENAPGVPREQLAHLQRFAVHLGPPSPGEQHAKSRIIWAPWSEKSPEAEAADAYLYLSIQSGDDHPAYGMELGAEWPRNPRSADSDGLAAFHSLVGAAFQADDATAQKTVWHSSMLPEIERWATRIEERKIARGESNPLRGLPFLNGVVRRDSKLVASIDVGEGMIHFLIDSNVGQSAPYKLVALAQVREGDTPRLASSLRAVGTKEGEIFGMLTTTEFKAALLDYLVRSDP